METQKTLDNCKFTEHVDSENYSYKNRQMDNSCMLIDGIIKKPYEKLSLIDSFQIKSIDKCEMESDVHQMIFNGNVDENNVINAVIGNILDKTKMTYNEAGEFERIITPEQSPSTKAQLRKKLDLGEFHKMIYRKQNVRRLQEEHNLIDLCENEIKFIESNVESTKNYCLYSFESVDFMVNTSPVKCELNFIKPTQLFPTTLFSSPLVNPRKLMIYTCPKLSKKYILPRKLIDEEENILPILFSKQNVALPDSIKLKLPLKYHILNKLFKAMETVSCKMYMRKEKNTFHKLKHRIQQITKKTFTEFHLAQIKTIVPEFYKFSLIKLPSDRSGYDLMITSVYGSINDNNIDLIKMTSRRKKIYFFNALIDIVKEHHKEYLSGLIPPIIINIDKITRWHSKFDVDFVPNINPSSLPKIEIDISKMESSENWDMFEKKNMYNDHSINKIKLPIIDSKSDLKEDLRSFPTCSPKIQNNQAEKTNVLTTRSERQLKENIMTNRLLDIARRIYSYFVQLQKNVLPLKKVIDQLKHNYPVSITNEDWKAHLNLLRKKVPHWILSKVFNGIEYIRINKKVEFKKTLINKLKK